MERLKTKQTTLCAHPGIVRNVEALGKVRCSCHRMVRSRISLHLRRKRKKLLSKKHINKLSVRAKREKFRISLQNRHSALTEETDFSIQALNDNLFEYH